MKLYSQTPFMHSTSVAYHYIRSILPPELERIVIYECPLITLCKFRRFDNWPGMLMNLVPRAQQTIL